MVGEGQEKRKTGLLLLLASQPVSAHHAGAMQSVPPHSATSGPIRIGWFTASCVLVSNIIGGGIFTTTGIMARDLGDPLVILLLWFLGSLFALGGAMVYAELGSLLPHAGGDYVYVRNAYGPLVAFLSGWTSFTIGFGAAVAASAISFSSYALRMVPLEDPTGWVAKGLSLGLLWIVTLVHCGGLGTGGYLQRLLTVTKILAVLGLILGGLFAGSGHWEQLLMRPTAPSSSLATLETSAIALVIVIYCYLGWNVVGYIAGEIDDPRRNLPRIVIGGTAVVSALYLLLNVVYLSALSIAELAQEPIIPVAEKTAAALWGPQSGRFVAAILCLSIAGAVSAMTWAGPRVYWAMARDGAISSWLAQLDPRTAVPSRAILFQTCWASLLILSGTFEQLLVYSGLVLALFMALSLSTIFRLRHRAIDHGQIYHAPLYPLLPLALVSVSLVIVIYSLIQRPTESLYGAVTVLTGIPLYYLSKQPAAPTAPTPISPKPRQTEE
jgi:basic amino acid/polyamine antiporter, APA family